MKGQPLFWQIFPFFFAVGILILYICYRLVNEFNGALWVAGGLVLLVTSVASWWTASRFKAPIELMKADVMRVKEGHFVGPIRLSAAVAREFHGLANVLNETAQTLQFNLEIIQRQKNLQEAILSSMTEGVFAVSAEEKLIFMNQAARRILDVDELKVKGAHLEAVVRAPDLQEFVKKVLLSRFSAETEFEVLSGDNEKILRARSGPLKNEDGGSGVCDQ